jgi:thiol:disulfide interchange protein DsbD
MRWCLAAAVLALAGCGGQPETAEAPSVSETVTSHGEVDVSWERDWQTAFRRARTEGKPVLVNFYAEWCVWCKHLESITFRDAEVAKLLAGQVVPLSVDIDAVDQQLLREHRVEAPPTIVLLGSDGREIGRIPGYMPPTGFLKTVESFLEPGVG